MLNHTSGTDGFRMLSVTAECYFAQESYFDSPNRRIHLQLEVGSCQILLQEIQTTTRLG
jgi:hypothetical protein